MDWNTVLVLLFVSLGAGCQPAMAQQSQAEGNNCVYAGATDQTVIIPRLPQNPIPQDYVDRGNALVCDQQWDAAIAAYQQAIAGYLQTPEPAPWITYVYFQLGDVLVRQNRLDEALANYRQAIAGDDIYGFLIGLFDDRQYSPLGEAITDASMRGDAYSAAVRAEASVDASAYYELGKELAAQNRLEDAIAAYHQAITLSPTFAYAYNALGEALYLQNQTDAAIAAYHDALRLNPNLVWGYYNLGQALAQENRLDEAIVAFRQVIGFHTGLDSLGGEIKENIAYSVLGDVLREQGNLSAAATAYRQAIAQDPADGTSYLNLGNVLLAQNQVDEAETAFRSALDRIEDYQVTQVAQAYNGLGKVLMQQNDLEGAIAAFQSALVFIPDWSEAQQNLQMAEAQLQR